MSGLYKLFLAGALIADSPVAMEDAEQFASLLGRLALPQQFGFAA